MTIALEPREGLTYFLHIDVSGDDVRQKLDEKVESYRGKLRLPGFRANRPLPIEVVRKRFLTSLQQELHQELIQKFLEDAVEEHQLDLVTKADIEEINLPADGSLKARLILEVFPELPSVDFAKVALVRPESDVSEEAIDEGIEKLRAEHRDWQDTEEPVGEGMRVIFDCSAVDAQGDKVEGTELTDMDSVLGEGKLLPEFEAGLMGKVAGDTVEFPLTFPDDYHAEALQGQKVLFSVTLKTAQVGALPEVTDEFAKQVEPGLENVEALRAFVRDLLSAELKKKLRHLLRRRFYVKLRELFPCDLPPTIEAHCQGIVEKAKQEGEDDEKALAEVESGARAMSRNSIIARHLIKMHNIVLDEARLKEAIREGTRFLPMGEWAEQWIYQNEREMERYRLEVLEDQLMDAVLALMTIESETLHYDQVNQELEKDPHG